MNRICTWCEKEWQADDAATDYVVTGNTCAACRGQLYDAASLCSLNEYLNHLDVPVLVMDDDVRVMDFNEPARALLGKSAADIEGYYGGDVIECVYAKLPEGCGNTEHCKACTIRKTVTNTHLTGDPHFRVPAYQDIQTANGAREMRYTISTEKVGQFVLLRIDEVTSTAA
jgi:PAS domain-containing protein